MFEKVSRLLKCDSILCTNIYMETNTNHITPAHACACRVTRKMVPITRRTSSFLVVLCVLRGWSFQKQHRKEEKEGETEQQQQQQTYQFTQGYNILHRLHVPHLTLTFIIHNIYIYINTIFIYIFIIHVNCSNHNIL